MTIKSAIIPAEAKNETNIEVKQLVLKTIDPNAKILTAKITKIHRMGEVEV
mgnify:CR=1 FL=1